MSSHDSHDHPAQRGVACAGSAPVATRSRSSRPKPLMWIVVLTCMALVGATTWHKVVRHEFLPRNFGAVDGASVYRSGQLSERMLRSVIVSHDLRTIIALNDDDDESAMERRVAAELNVARIGFDLSGDGTGSPELYAEVVSIMADPARQPVLVHCAAGAQRTTTAVVLYRHLVQNVPVADAYPESFDFKHKPDEWKVLSYLADHMDEIRSAYVPQ